MKMATAKPLKPKEIMENSLVLIVISSVLGGFGAGIGVMSFLENRDKEIVAELQQKNTKLAADNATLNVSNEQLDKAIRAALYRIVVQHDDVLGGANAEVRKISPDVLKESIDSAPRHTIEAAINDPVRNLRSVFRNPF
jgi:hypothetical protein